MPANGNGSAVLLRCFLDGQQVCRDDAIVGLSARCCIDSSIYQPRPRDFFGGVGDSALGHPHPRSPCGLFLHHHLHFLLRVNCVGFAARQQDTRRPPAMRAGRPGFPKPVKWSRPFSLNSRADSGSTIFSNKSERDCPKKEGW
jgi:hypothetical protein